MNLFNFKNIYKRSGFYGWLALPMILIFFLSVYSGVYSTGEKLSVAKNEEVEEIMYRPNSEFNWQGTGLVTFWFDDAWLSEYDPGAEYLRSQGYVASLAVTTNYVDYPGYMTWSQIKRVAHWGWEISAHSRTHQCNPQDMSPEMLKSEVLESGKILEKYGFLTETFVAPCGAITEEMLSLAKNYYKSLRGTHGGLNSIPVVDPFNLNAVSVTPSTTHDEMAYWINEAKRTKSWLIIVVHQIDDTGDQYSISFDQYKDIVEQVKNSGLPVVLPAQALGIKN